jgi:hypothetical protein
MWLIAILLKTLLVAEKAIVGLGIAAPAGGAHPTLHLVDNRVVVTPRPAMFDIVVHEWLRFILVADRRESSSDEPEQHLRPNSNFLTI